jgi:hypothetical protein
MRCLLCWFFPLVACAAVLGCVQQPTPPAGADVSEEQRPKEKKSQRFPPKESPPGR